MTVRQLLSSLDSAELTDWMAYFEIERRKAEMPPGGSAAEQLYKLFGPEGK